MSIIVFKEGKVLLGKRAKDPRLIWSFPGGAVEPGEDAVSAAKRELLEETGLVASELQFVGYADSPISTQSWVTLVFKCNSFSGNPQVREPDKMVDWTWFSKGEVPSSLFKHTAEAIEKKMVWND